MTIKTNAQFLPFLKNPMQNFINYALYTEHKYFQISVNRFSKMAHKNWLLHTWRRL